MKERAGHKVSSYRVLGPKHESSIGLIALYALLSVNTAT